MLALKTILLQGFLFIFLLSFLFTCVLHLLYSNMKQNKNPLLLREWINLRDTLYNKSYILSYHLKCPSKTL